MRLDSVVKRFIVGDNGVAIREFDDYGVALEDADSFPFDFICSCPNCNGTVFVQAEAKVKVARSEVTYHALERIEESSGGKVLAIYPYRRSVSLPPELPAKYSDDFRQALLVLDLSPMASAALSRRILQNILRDEFNLQPSSLAKEIDAFIALPNIPSRLKDDIDAIRNVGNFAAHPLKDTSTREIVTVEPGEAEWLIDVLSSLFDFQFIEPKRSQERKDRLNTKLRGMGKPEMK